MKCGWMCGFEEEEIREIESRDLPSSRTSMMAIFGDAIDGESRLEDEVAKSIWERSVEERRGRVAIVCFVILSIQ